MIESWRGLLKIYSSSSHVLIQRLKIWRFMDNKYRNWNLKNWRHYHFVPVLCSSRKFLFFATLRIGKCFSTFIFLLTIRFPYMCRQFYASLPCCKNKKSKYKTINRQEKTHRNKNTKTGIYNKQQTEKLWKDDGVFSIFFLFRRCFSKAKPLIQLFAVAMVDSTINVGKWVGALV